RPSGIIQGDLRIVAKKPWALRVDALADEIVWRDYDPFDIVRGAAQCGGPDASIALVDLIVERNARWREIDVGAVDVDQNAPTVVMLGEEDDEGMRRIA